MKNNLKSKITFASFTAMIIIALFGSLGAFAQELNTYAQTIKKVLPETYANIEYKAKQEWPGDFAMQIYTINKQATSYDEFAEALKNANEDTKPIIIKSISEWIEPSPIAKSTWTGLDIYIVDWSMVMYTYKKQIKAFNSLK